LHFRKDRDQTCNLAKPQGPKMQFTLNLIYLKVEVHRKFHPKNNNFNIGFANFKLRVIIIQTVTYCLVYCKAYHNGSENIGCEYGSTDLDIGRAQCEHFFLKSPATKTHYGLLQRPILKHKKLTKILPFNTQTHIVNFYVHH
jgi:hypothetical protein